MTCTKLTHSLPSRDERTQASLIPRSPDCMETRLRLFLGRDEVRYAVLGQNDSLCAPEGRHEPCLTRHHLRR